MCSFEEVFFLLSLIKFNYPIKHSLPLSYELGKENTFNPLYKSLRYYGTIKLWTLHCIGRGKGQKIEQTFNILLNKLRFYSGYMSYKVYKVTESSKLLCIKGSLDWDGLPLLCLDQMERRIPLKQDYLRIESGTDVRLCYKSVVVVKLKKYFKNIGIPVPIISPLLSKQAIGWMLNSQYKVCGPTQDLHPFDQKLSEAKKKYIYIFLIKWINGK